MSQQELTAFIVEYIAGRRQAKLEAFDKASAKRLAADPTEEGDILQARRELELRYTVPNWLTEAAKRAGQISLVTHAAKFTHGDAKNSSIFSETIACEGYLSTATLSQPAADAVGNAAALDVAKLLQTEVAGDSLLACLKRNEASPLAPLAESPQQLSEWVDGFSCALTVKDPTSHKLAKQVYFPVDGGYHLLNPLFSSSLAQALHQRMVALRFSEQTKALWQARRKNEWHPGMLVIFPDTAVVNFGGTKPQNISALNSGRGGRTWLLPARPPVWESQDKPPLAMATLFGPGAFDRVTRQARRQLIHLLISTEETQNRHIRRQRDQYIDEIIDLLFNVAAGIQRRDWAGWTLEEGCTLKAHQRLWLDPWRTETDEAFRSGRESDDWQKCVADDFALWLNGHLKRAGLSMGLTERREWRTKPRFQYRLREMERALTRYRDA
ncbi:type I-F CRISPR-associated protein Csy1 [Shimwellia pseudoproteus]|uniref:type I-F CRISPR-associated protein Csy1 n=1 Tax=Shimwellia pseudoproteus TaxID=570012 RepID=UPI0018EE11A5|nr:type I-F CRISPR-associated protein Csy1 [Shimwellia pseudoproteus]MBJ3814243.1 type I-F CRISPR-associated protein Csy1 [Shimwellia pseudoproteus]